MLLERVARKSTRIDRIARGSPAVVKSTWDLGQRIGKRTAIFFWSKVAACSRRQEATRKMLLVLMTGQQSFFCPSRRIDIQECNGADSDQGVTTKVSRSVVRRFALESNLLVSRG